MSNVPGSERLEFVRERSGAENLREFWKALIERTPADYRVSYEAVRNYHAGRDAPVDYLVRVADAFGFRLEWLATGRGYRTHAEEKEAMLAEQTLQGFQRNRTADVLDEVARGVAEGMGVPEPPKTGTYAAPSWLSSVVHIWSSASLYAFEASSEVDELDGVEVRHGRDVNEGNVAREVGEALAAPLKALGSSPEDLTEFELRNYVFAMVAALAPVIHHYSGPKEESDA